MVLYLDNSTNKDYDIHFFENIISTAQNCLEFDNDQELSVVLTDDSEIKTLNKTYRGIDLATDVLSFPINEDNMLGDIVISIETAKEQAIKEDLPLDTEVAFLFIHGFLHLLGFDHEIQDDERKMFAIQEEILFKWQDNYGK